MSQHIPPKGFYVLNRTKFADIIKDGWIEYLYSSGTNKGNMWIRPKQGHKKWCHYQCMPSKKKLAENYEYLGAIKSDNIPNITNIY
jgi:hypothetical protein